MDYKPGSVPFCNGACHLSRLNVTIQFIFSVLPCSSGEQPSSATIHELAASKVYSKYVTILLVGSYPAFSPLQPLKTMIAVIFFYTSQLSQTTSILGSGVLCAARTFLSCNASATSRPSVYLCAKLQNIYYNHLITRFLFFAIISLCDIVLLNMVPTLCF